MNNTYLIIRDVPSKNDGILWDILKRSKEQIPSECKLAILSLLKEPQINGLDPAISKLEACRAQWEREIYNINPEKILVIGNSAAKLLLGFDNLKRKRRRWGEGVLGISGTAWLKQNSNRFMPTATGRKKIGKVSEEDALAYAETQAFITDFPKKYIGMFSFTEKQLIASPELEGAFYEDLKYFIECNSGCNTPSDIRAVIDNISNDEVPHAYMVVDTETNDVDIRQIKSVPVVCYATRECQAVSGSGDGAVESNNPERIQLGHLDGRGWLGERGRSPLQGWGRAELALDPSTPVLGFNTKFDLRVLKKMGINLAPPYADAMLLMHLMNEHLPEKDLKTAVRLYVPEFPEHDLGIETYKKEGLLKDPDTGKDDYTRMPYEKLKYYCEGDVAATAILYERLLAKATPEQKAVLAEL